MAVVFGNASNISFTVSPAKWSNSACGGYSSMTSMATNTFLNLGSHFVHRSACFCPLKGGILGNSAPLWQPSSSLRLKNHQDQELHPLALIASSQLTSLHQIRCLYNVSMVKVLEVRKKDALSRQN